MRVSELANKSFRLDYKRLCQVIKNILVLSQSVELNHLSLSRFLLANSLGECVHLTFAHVYVY